MLLPQLPEYWDFGHKPHTELQSHILTTPATASVPSVPGQKSKTVKGNVTYDER
jgi:hypothetical protein